MRPNDRCPKCDSDKLACVFNPRPVEHLELSCPTCGFTFERPCADAGAGALTVERVQRTVCDYYGVTLRELVSRDRHKSLAEARMVAAFFARTLVPSTPSYPELGRWFGKRDHTTMMGAVKRGEKIVGDKPELRMLFDKPETQLGLPGVVKTRATETSARTVAS